MVKYGRSTPGEGGKWKREKSLKNLNGMVLPPSWHVVVDDVCVVPSVIEEQLVCILTLEIQSK